MDKIQSESLYSGNTMNIRLEDGYLNGLGIFITGGVEASTITAKYKRGDQPAIYLANELPLSQLQAINDSEGGHKLTNTTTLQEIINVLDELAVKDGVVTQLTAPVSGFADRTFKTNIDFSLGSIPLHNATLDITINMSFAGGGQRNVAVYRYENGRTNAFFKKYEQSTELKETYTNVSSIYAFPATVNQSADVSFEIRDFFETTKSDYEALHQWTLKESEMEIIPVDDVAVRVYRPVTTIPETVRVEKSGADASTTALLVVQTIYSGGLLTESYRDQQKIASRLEAFRKEQPDAYRGFRAVNG